VRLHNHILIGKFTNTESHAKAFGLLKNIKHFFIFSGFFFIYDMPLPKYVLFQDPATIAMLNIINFHHDLF